MNSDRIHVCSHLHLSSCTHLLEDFTFEIAVTFAVLFAVVFSAVVIKLPEKSTAGFCCTSSLSSYVLNCSDRKILPNIHCELSSGNTIVRCACPHSWPALLSHTTFKHCSHGLPWSIALKHSCQTWLPNIGAQHCCEVALFRDHWPGSSVMHCCKILSRMSPPRHIMYRHFKCHSRTALCTCKLTPNSWHVWSALPSAFCMSLPESYAACRGP